MLRMPILSVRCRLRWTAVILGAFYAVCAAPAAVQAADPLPAPPPLIPTGAQLAEQVSIYRDAYGVPHIDAQDDVAACFGSGYAQAEDHFYQVEDNYLLGLGRYAERHGPVGLNSDLLNRAFEIVPRSQADYARLPRELQQLCAAFAEGLNYYLETHPEVRPKLLHRFEPWHVVAYGRQVVLELTFRYTRLSSNFLPRTNPRIAAATGSNAWALSGNRTRSGHAMLVINPHQPWFGFGQFWEVHLRSRAGGWDFTGGAFLGSPLPALGHNEHMGFAYTTNEPDIADVWKIAFDDPSAPLNYRYGDGYRTAEEWTDVIRVRAGAELLEERYTFRKTHHGPLVTEPSDDAQLAVQIGGLFDGILLQQLRQLVAVRNVAEFRTAMQGHHLPLMNTIYADKQGDIYYLYNGAIPRRDPNFDWQHPVDGSDPRAEWQGYHPLEELPAVLNPASGYLQNCNSSPFTTSDADNPRREDFPPYMIEDADDDKRRAQRSRILLRDMHDVTFDELQAAAFDTQVLWAAEQLPVYRAAWESLQQSDPALARRVQPYLEHLWDWDCRITADSTQATLCTIWYEELYGYDYPGETLREQYVENYPEQFLALLRAAVRLQHRYGDWRVAWGRVHRLQRVPDGPDLLTIGFSDRLPSLPCEGGHGPMGVIFTQYYAPPLTIPFLPARRNYYGIVGFTYTSVIEFGPQIRAATSLNFGQSGDPSSPHYFDQARLLSERRLKPELFVWDEIAAQAVRKYQPGPAPGTAAITQP